MTHRRRDSGFAMPVAIFALVILGVLVTAGFFMARQEGKIGSASENGALAFYLAEKGMKTVLEEWKAEDFRSLAILADTTVDGSEDEGTWQVDIFRASQKMIFLDATGTITRGGALLSGAQRRVGTIARLFYADIEPPAALTTRGETDISGTADIFGGDSIPEDWDDSGRCDSIPQVDKPGVMSDDSSLVDNQGNSTISGNPAKDQDTSINDSTFLVFGNLTYDDLVAMAQWHRPADASSTVSRAQPSYTVGNLCDTSDPDNWGEPENLPDPCDNWFPITHFSGDGNIQGDVGQGIILVDGNLTIQGNFVFYGLIIVQGTVDMRGTGQGIKIFGGVMASNVDLDDQNVTGGSSIHNSTCVVDQAIRNNSGTARGRPLLLRSWVDLSSIEPPTT